MVKPEWTINMKEVGCSSPRLDVLMAQFCFIWGVNGMR